MRQNAEAVRARKLQVQQQQIGVRTPFEGVKQACHAIGLEELAIFAGGRDSAPERCAVQRMVIDDEDFVVHLRAVAWLDVSHRAILRHPGEFQRPIYANCDQSRMSQRARGEQT
jgi:hypothetical protein